MDVGQARGARAGQVRGRGDGEGATRASEPANGAARTAKLSQIEEILDAIDGIAWEADAETFRFLYVSARAEQILGYPVARWIEEPSFWVDHLHPDDRDWCMQFCKESTGQGVPHRFEYRMLAADGKVVWLRGHVRVVVEDGRPARLRGVMVNITETKEAEEQLEHTVSLLRATLDATADGILATSAGGAAITACNPQFARIWRRPRHAFEQKSVEQAATSVLDELVDPAGFQAKVRWLYEHPEEESYDVIAFKDGRIVERYSRPQRSGQEVIGRVCSYRDVTRRIHAEDERDRLLVEERRLRAEAERAHARMAFLAEASRTLAASLDVRSTLAAVIDLVVPRLAPWCALILPGGTSGDGPPMTAAAHESPTIGDRLFPLLGHHLPGPDDPLGFDEVRRSGETLVAPKVPSEALRAAARDEAHLALLRALGATSRVIVPLGIHGRTLGLLAVGARAEPADLAPADVALFEELGRRCATALENTRLYHEAQDALRAAMVHMTEQKQASDACAQHYRDAQEAVRVRDDFLTLASHEIKTPLTTLTLRLEQMSRRLRAGKPVDASLLGQALAQVERLTALSSDLLDVSRIADGRLAIRRDPLSLREVVAEAVATARASTDKHAIVLVEHEHEHEHGDDVVVSGDRERLLQVVSNLLDNAMKYTPSGGTIRVALSSRDGEALLSVTDPGIGVPREQQARLFERFFRARNSPSSSYGGLGLGLYICRDIVERHGGRIWVDSELGEGSTFRVALPLDGVERVERAERAGGAVTAR